MVADDAFGLKKQTFIVRNEDWSFQTSDQQLESFEKWLQDEVEKEFSGDWWKGYIDEGYRKGFGRSFDDMKGLGGSDDAFEQGRFQGTKEEFLRSAFGQAVTKEKLDLIMMRVMTDLVGVTDGMALRLKRILIDGMIAGKDPRSIARDLRRQLDISRRRAETIARTEIIRAHAEGQLDLLERMGAKKLKVQVEWLTSGDDRVCQQCADQEGKVFEFEEARNRIPLHPNCRCAWMPANVGEAALPSRRRK